MFQAMRAMAALSGIDLTKPVLSNVDLDIEQDETIDVLIIETDHSKNASRTVERH